MIINYALSINFFFVKYIKKYSSIMVNTVLEFDWNGNLLIEYITYNSFQSNWKYGIPRGGTNPIYNRFSFGIF